MTKNLLRLTVAIIMAVFVKGAALAETTVYGIVSGSLNDMVVSFDFDALDPEGVTTPTFTNVQDLPDVVDELCGVSVGNYFYAYYYDANYSLNFGTINFSTGTVTSINKFSVSNSPEVSAMALDAESGEVYGISTGFNDETGKQESRLVKVNTADGSTTVLQTMAKLNNAAIVSDNAGGFYLFGCKLSSSFQYYPVVKHVDATGAITDVFGDQSIKLSGTTFNCAYRAADKIYYITGTTVYNYDPTANTMTKTGVLPKGIFALTSVLSSEDGQSGAPVQKSRLLVSKKWYGDFMGTADPNLDMTKTEYFYDTNSRLVRCIESGRTYDTNQYEMSAYNKYQYDDNGNLTSFLRYQYGVYDYGDMALKLRSEETYEYDGNGNMTKKVTSSYTYLYEYDEAGNCIKETITNAAGSVIQVLEYSDFIALNKPEFVVSTCPEHPEWTGYVYVAVRTYDENNNLTSENRYVNTDTPTPFMKEAWTYADGMLTLYTKDEYSKTSGKLVSQLKTVYETVDGNPDLVRETTYTAYGDSDWAMSGRPCVSEYRSFDDQLDNCFMELGIVPVEDAKNTNKVVFSVPAMAYNGKCRIDLYRNGQVIYSKEVMDIVDDMAARGEEFTGMSLSYIDKDLQNGDYDYFIQPMVGPSTSIWAEGDEETVTTDDYVGYFISPVVESSLNIELPVVTNLHVSNARKNEHNENIFTISWTNPVDMTDYGFKSNELYFENMQLAEADTTDAACTSLEANFYTKKMNVFVLTRYVYGKAISDTLAVDVNDVLAGITTVNGNGNEISFDGNTFSVAGNANISVYSASGALKTRANNASSVGIDNLPTGVYIICVEQKGSRDLYKITVK